MIMEKMKKNEERQLQLFDTDEYRPEVKRPRRDGGSGNPIVFHDYESFVAKFKDNPKTTDDCYTPRDVFEAVVDYVGRTFGLEGKVILRPFYPGGDYESAEYPENGVVIDNPPFSMFTSIVKFYVARGVPFFLFGPGMTIFSICQYCTAVIIGTNVKFENGADVRLNFATNMAGDMVAMTAPALDAALCRLESQNQKANLAVYRYPEEMLSVSDMQTMAHGGRRFDVRRSECVVVRNLDNAPKKGLFGNRLLITAAKAAAKAAIPVPLSDREKKIIKGLKD